MQISKINHVNFKGDLDKPYSRKEDGFGRHYGYIYKVQNKINEDCFIGLTTKHPEEQRKILLDLNVRYPLLNEAIQKYGFNNFTFNVIDYADDYNSLVTLRQHLIKNPNTTYNAKFQKFDELISIDIDGNVEFLKDHPEKKEGLMSAQAAINNCFYISQESVLGRCWTTIDRYERMSDKEKELYIRMCVRFLKDKEAQKRKFVDLISVDEKGVLRYTKDHEDDELVEKYKDSIYASVSGGHRGAAGRCWISEYIFNKLPDEEKENFISQSVAFLKEYGSRKLENNLIYVTKDGEVKLSKDLDFDRKNEIAQNRQKILSFMSGKGKNALGLYWIKQEKFNKMSKEEQETFVKEAIRYLQNLEKYDFEIDDLISVDEYGNIRQAKDHKEEKEQIQDNEREIFLQLSGQLDSAIDRVFIKKEDYMSMSKEERKDFLINAIKTLKNKSVYVVKKNGSYKHYSNIEDLSKQSEVPVNSIKRSLNGKTLNFTFNGYVLSLQECKHRFPEIYNREMQKVKIQRV